MEVNVYYNYASSLTGWCHGVRENKSRLHWFWWFLFHLLSPKGIMYFTTLLLFTDRDYLPKHKTYSNMPPEFLRWHKYQLQKVLYFFSETFNFSYLHIVSATLCLQCLFSKSCINSIVSWMNTVLSCVNSFYCAWIFQF